VKIRAAWSWLALALILALYVISLVHLHPTNFFGLTEDDSIYFSSAKALAHHQGYILPNVPDNPPATKYPIGYSFILAHIWQQHPSFPANIAAALRVNAIFGCFFIVLIFLLFSRFKDLTPIETILLTAFCALHPVLLFYSGNVLSEIPFCAVTLAAILIADRDRQTSGKVPAAIACGLLAGSSILLRVFGVTIVAGIALSGLLRRAWRQTIIFCAAALPFFLFLARQQLIRHAPAPSAAPALASAGDGWIRTYAYYTNYLAFWKISVPNANIFWAMLRNNFVTLIQSPSDYLLYPLFSRSDALGIAVVTVIAAVTVLGMRRQAIRNGWLPIHSTFVCYLPLILLWNYPDSTHRFLLPFLPLFIAGFWTEMKHILQMVSRALRSKKSVADKIVAAAFGCALILFACSILWNYAGGMRTLIREKSLDRASLLASKREAYRWLDSSTAPTDRLIAWEDGVAYLYTGRACMRPMVFTTAELYDSDHIDDAVDHMPDVARTIHAAYWIFSDDDFEAEFPDGTAAARAELASLETVLPLSFQSADGRVRVRSLDCYLNPSKATCAEPAPLVNGDTYGDTPAAPANK
jgi:hypothetical protein